LSTQWQPPTFSFNTAPTTSFSQVAFSKTWEGVPTIGIVIRQEFHEVPDAKVGDTVEMRSEDRVGASVERKDTNGIWVRLGRGRAI
jgi:hypothetical protein